MTFNSSNTNIRPKNLDTPCAGTNSEERRGCCRAISFDNIIIVDLSREPSIQSFTIIHKAHWKT